MDVSFHIVTYNKEKKGQSSCALLSATKMYWGDDGIFPPHSFFFSASVVDECPVSCAG
jgi:hypothetical protein